MLSIIIPTLNEEKYLPRLLESIESQEYPDLEVIVSDGGSTDSTKAIADKYGVRFVSDTTIKHPSAQRNHGAKHASGDILIFLDADCVLQSGFIKKAVAEFTDRGLIGAGCYIRFNPNRNKYRIFALISNIVCALKQKTSNPAAVGACIISRREMHELIGGFDLRVLLAEDYDYCARLASIGKFRILNSVRLLYSSRRMEKDGYWRTGWKWFRMGMYTLTNRKIKKDIVKYDFGKF